MARGWGAQAGPRSLACSPPAQGRAGKQQGAGGSWAESVCVVCGRVFWGAPELSLKALRYQPNLAPEGWLGRMRTRREGRYRQHFLGRAFGQARRGSTGRAVQHMGAGAASGHLDAGMALGWVVLGSFRCLAGACHGPR